MLRFHQDFGQSGSERDGFGEESGCRFRAKGLAFGDDGDNIAVF